MIEMSSEMKALYNKMSDNEKAMADDITKAESTEKRNRLLDNVFATQFSNSLIARWAWKAENWY